MKRHLLLFCISLLSLPFCSRGQIQYPPLAGVDSTTFTFSAGDSLHHHVTSGFFGSGPFATIVVDTTSDTLWRIGNTLKPVFSNTVTPTRGIMTDTLNPYPRNANASFVLKFTPIPNFIIDIWHRYETDSLHAGGIVEFSTDSGATWLNISDCQMINKQNYYSQTDTIVGNQPAFTGRSNGQRYSRFQFINCVGVKETATGCPFLFMSTHAEMYIRFRFYSDTATDTLSGWKIDSIQVVNPGCFPGAVKTVSNDVAISIMPNPATSQLSLTASDKITSVTITDMLGRQVYSRACNTTTLDINVRDMLKGVYLVRIESGGEVIFRKFVKE